METKKATGDQIILATHKVPQKPLDFSFLKIVDIGQLRKEVARGGKRRPIPESDDEEDQKKNESANQAQVDEAVVDEKAAEKEMVIRAPQVSQISQILSNHHVPLQQHKASMMGGGSRKTEDTQKTGGVTKKMQVNRVTTTLFLQNNQIRTIAEQSKPENCLFSVLQDVMFTTNHLVWLDLSYNYLVNIEDEILKIPQLQTLYLQCNFIRNLEETRKLAQLTELKTLNLFGNPIEQIPGYRLFVLGNIYSENDALKRLDQVVITAKEYASVCIWNERLVANSSKKLKKVSENYFAKNAVAVKCPPPLKVDDDEKAKGGAGAAGATENA